MPVSAKRRIKLTGAVFPDTGLDRVAELAKERAILDYAIELGLESPTLERALDGGVSLVGTVTAGRQSDLDTVATDIGLRVGRMFFDSKALPTVTEAE